MGLIKLGKSKFLLSTSHTSLHVAEEFLKSKLQIGIEFEVGPIGYNYVLYVLINFTITLTELYKIQNCIVYVCKALL